MRLLAFGEVTRWTLDQSHGLGRRSIRRGGLSEKRCDVSGQGMPIGAGICSSGMLEKVPIELDGILITGGGFPEGGVVRMHIQKSHSALRGKPGKLVFPDLVSLLAQKNKERGVLRERVWKLDDWIAIGALDQERENCLRRV